MAAALPLLLLLSTHPTAADPAMDHTDILPESAGPVADAINDVFYYGDCVKAGLVPVTEQIGHGASWVQFWRGPYGHMGLERSVIGVSWHMAGTMSIGADEYTMAIILEDGTREFRKLFQGTHQKDRHCVFLTMMEPNPIYFTVLGGIDGWRGSDSCTSSKYWKSETTTEVMVDVKNPKGTVKNTITYGGSAACTDSTEYDSEIAIGTQGWMDPLATLPGQHL